MSLRPVDAASPERERDALYDGHAGALSAVVLEVQRPDDPAAMLEHQAVAPDALPVETSRLAQVQRRIDVSHAYPDPAHGVRLGRKRLEEVAERTEPRIAALEERGHGHRSAGLRENIPRAGGKTHGALAQRKVQADVEAVCEADSKNSRDCAQEDGEPRRGEESPAAPPDAPQRGDGLGREEERGDREDEAGDERPGGDEPGGEVEDLGVERHVAEGRTIRPGPFHESVPGPTRDDGQQRDRRRGGGGGIHEPRAGGDGDGAPKHALHGKCADAGKEGDESDVVEKRGREHADEREGRHEGDDDVQQGNGPDAEELAEHQVALPDGRGEEDVDAPGPSLVAPDVHPENCGEERKRRGERHGPKRRKLDAQAFRLLEAERERKG